MSFQNYQKGNWIALFVTCEYGIILGQNYYNEEYCQFHLDLFKVSFSPSVIVWGLIDGFQLWFSCSCVWYSGPVLPCYYDTVCRLKVLNCFSHPCFAWIFPPVYLLRFSKLFMPNRNKGPQLRDLLGSILVFWKKLQIPSFFLGLLYMSRQITNCSFKIHLSHLKPSYSLFLHTYIHICSTKSGLPKSRWPFDDIINKILYVYVSRIL